MKGAFCKREIATTDCPNPCVIPFHDIIWFACNATINQPTTNNARQHHKSDTTING